MCSMCDNIEALIHSDRIHVCSMCDNIEALIPIVSVILLNFSAISDTIGISASILSHIENT